MAMIPTVFEYKLKLLAITCIYRLVYHLHVFVLSFFQHECLPGVVESKL